MRTYGESGRVGGYTRNCKDFVVKAGPPQILRGRTSGRDCLTTAIREYREGDHEEAFGWILAGACPNRGA